MAASDCDMAQRLAVLEACMRDFNSELTVDGLLVSHTVYINECSKVEHFLTLLKCTKWKSYLFQRFLVHIICTYTAALFSNVRLCLMQSILRT